MLSKTSVLTRPNEVAPSTKTVLREVEIDACPNCGAQGVHWRRRRFYDVVFTWLGAGMLSSGAYSQYDDTYWPQPYEYNQSLLSEDLWVTPRRFWKCRDCKQCGEEY